MFCVIYRFNVKPRCDSDFRHHWLAVTKHLYRHAGSLGSRLHRADAGEYVGYAQWPSREQWAQQRDKQDAELQAHRQAMRECCESIEVVCEMDVLDDYLRQDVYGG